MKKSIVAISTDFLSAMNELPKQQKDKVIAFVTKFRSNPSLPGLNFEKLNASSENLYSVRIDNTYRAIVAKENGTYLLLWVAGHEDAYKWAASKKCKINTETGSIQVFDVQKATVEEKKKKTASKTSVFGKVSDEQFIKMGVPEEQMPLLKSIATEEEFYANASCFAADTYEALEYIVNGFSPDEVIESLIEKNTVSKKDKENFEKALQNPQSKRSFVIVSDDEEIIRLMNAPLEKWRTFLHPSQQKIVTKDYKGPAQVLGGAGTGKTVVAMHRAKWLAQKLSGRERLLFTTFTSNLAKDIEDNLRKICSVEENRKIEVVNFDSWVNTYLKNKKYDYDIKYEDDLAAVWKDAIEYSATTLSFDEAFYAEEWSKVVCANDAFSKEDYFRAPRIGRGTRLSRKDRLEVWKVFEEYRTLLNEKGIRDVELAMYECRALLQDKVYNHIIVDEGQDLSTSAFKLIRKLAGEEHQNDIFIVGDTHQRIYKYRTVLSRCGINIKGRSSRLKINYRTTEEIRKFAFSILNGISFDDMDDAYDDGRVCQSLTHGNRPEFKNFKTQDKELEYIAGKIKELQEDKVATKDICLVARTKKICGDYKKYLEGKKIKCYELKSNQDDDRSREGVRIATMHRVKGLEFEYVLLVSANDNVLPLKAAMNGSDDVSKEEALTGEKCLIYVALTRAKKETFISSYGKKSKLIK